MKKIGIVTIGQSPRPDVVKEMAPFFGKNVSVLERGALDGLTLEQVKEFSPGIGMTPLVTRMKDGTEVIIAKEEILRRIERSQVRDREDCDSFQLHRGSDNWRAA